MLQIQSLQQELEALRSPVVFCHCDLLNANLIYNKEGDTISFIDVEYACYNYQGFDIGNHFNEFAGILLRWFCSWTSNLHERAWKTHYLSVLGFECDFSLYPKKDFQIIWLRNYLSAVHPGIVLNMWSILCLVFSLANLANY